MERRRPKNLAEGQLFDELTEQGWEVFKRGWPDYICRRGDEVMVVEVKPGPGTSLKRDQEWVMQLLASHGLKVYVWNPKTGARRIEAPQV